MPKDIERVRGNLSTDVVQRKEQWLSNRVQAKIGEEWNRDSCQHQQTQEYGNEYCPIVHQKVTATAHEAIQARKLLFMHSLNLLCILCAYLFCCHVPALFQRLIRHERLSLDRYMLYV